MVDNSRSSSSRRERDRGRQADSNLEQRLLQLVLAHLTHEILSRELEDAAVGELLVDAALLLEGLVRDAEVALQDLTHAELLKVLA